MSLWERLAPRTVPVEVIEVRPRERVQPYKVEKVVVHAPVPEGTETEDMHPDTGTIIARSQPVLDPNHVTRLVAQSDAAPQASRSGGNAHGYMHLSSLIDLCAREHTISHQHGVPIHESVAGPMRIIWAIGRAVEKHIRNGVIVARDWCNVYGTWVCRCGASNHRGLHPKGRSCPVCHKGLHNYREPLLVDHDAGVIGSPDITLIEMGFFLATEIKSMNKDQFDGLEAPLADHVLQALGYRHLYKLMGFPVLDVVSVVYGRKDFKFGGSRAVYKEFHVHYADWQGQIERMFNTAREIKEANAAGRLLPRPANCQTSTAKRAVKCKRCNLCSSLT